MDFHPVNLDTESPVGCWYPPELALGQRGVQGAAAPQRWAQLKQGTTKPRANLRAQLLLVNKPARGKAREAGCSASARSVLSSAPWLLLPQGQDRQEQPPAGSLTFGHSRKSEAGIKKLDFPLFRGPPPQHGAGSGAGRRTHCLRSRQLPRMPSPPSLVQRQRKTKRQRRGQGVIGAAAGTLAPATGQSPGLPAGCNAPGVGCKHAGAAQQFQGLQTPPSRLYFTHQLQVTGPCLLLGRKVVCLRA